MDKFLEEILKFLKFSWKRQRYEYRFTSFNGNSENNDIKVSNSLEYEFINSGSTIVILNDSLKLYPKFLGVGPDRIKMTVNKNEQDVTVYSYEFVPIDPATDFLYTGYFDFAGGDTIFKLYNSAPLAAPAPVNLLQVIIKQTSTQRD